MSPELRAGGTDLSERRRSGVSRGPIRDLGAEVPSGVTAAEGGLRLGARTSVAALAADPALAAYPGLAAAAAGLATPQIRRVATLGGNLAQASRCWYFRNPEIGCLKKGGSGCPARTGNALYAVAFDTVPCAAPHPSTLAAALMAYEARVVTDRRELPVAEALDALAPGEVITAISLPPPLSGERGAYKRAIGRVHAEWPLAELVVSAVIEGGTFARLRLVAGGVAPLPLRLHAAEAAALGKPATPATAVLVAEAATQGANPLPQAAYKLALLRGLVRDLLAAGV